MLNLLQEDLLPAQEFCAGVGVEMDALTHFYRIDFSNQQGYPVVLYAYGYTDDGIGNYGDPCKQFVTGSAAHSVRNGRHLFIEISTPVDIHGE